MSKCLIEPYIGPENDTLFYIVTYGDNEGWKILSSDKRTPAILAESERGEFSPCENNGICSWIEEMAKDMSIIKRLPDEELNFTFDDIELNRSVWTGQTVNRVVEEQGCRSGHWEVTVTSEVISLSSVDHLTPRWDQWRPYNSLSPWRTDTLSRAPAGCVAIAASQILYFLHNRINTPVATFELGFCNGSVNNDYYEFSNWSSSIWSQMDTLYTSSSTGTLAEAVLIGYVGRLVGMHYNNTFSWAIPAHLVSSVFDYYGISCSHSSYSASVAENSILNAMPVIVAASDLLIPTDGDIHCFVIDGYWITKTKYTYYYHWVQDGFIIGPELPIGIEGMSDLHEDYIVIEYSDPQLRYVKMNWGWWTQWVNHVNDGWYSLTGNWYVTHNNEYYDYNHNKTMIYGFSAQ